MVEPFISVITLWAGVYAPKGWMFCEGQILPINRYQALFSLIGDYYGGDGRSTFQLPDLREKDGDGAPISMAYNVKEGKVAHIICIEGLYPQRD